LEFCIEGVDGQASTNRAMTARVPGKGTKERLIESSAGNDGEKHWDGIVFVREERHNGEWQIRPMLCIAKTRRRRTC
jgi:hypothetical protein